MKYQFVEQHQAEFPIRVLCKVLEVNESGYYGWQKRKSREPGSRQKADETLADEIEIVFEQSRQTYGSPRIQAALRSKGMSCSRRRVARLMRKKKWVSCWRRRKRKVVTTDSQHH